MGDKVGVLILLFVYWFERPAICNKRNITSSISFSTSLVIYVELLVLSSALLGSCSVGNGSDADGDDDGNDGDDDDGGDDDDDGKVVVVVRVWYSCKRRRAPESRRPGYTCVVTTPAHSVLASIAYMFMLFVFFFLFISLLREQGDWGEEEEWGEEGRTYTFAGDLLQKINAGNKAAMDTVRAAGI